MLGKKSKILLMIEAGGEGGRACKEQFDREGEERSERRRLPIVSSASRRISRAYIDRPSSRIMTC